MLNTQVVVRVRKNRTQILRMPVRHASAHQQACLLRLHRVYVAVSSSFHLLWPACMRQFLEYDGICKARGVKNDYSTRVHVRQDWLQVKQKGDEDILKTATTVVLWMWVLVCRVQNIR